MNLDNKQKALEYISNKRKREMSYREISEHLNKDGIKSPRGGKWNTQKTMTFFKKNFKSSPATKTTTHSVAPNGVISKNTLKTILSDSTLTNEQKINVVMALC